VRTQTPPEWYLTVASTRADAQASPAPTYPAQAASAPSDKLE
jgi:hypothetical protein